MKFKTGDKVIVIAGKDKGTESKITKVFRDENKVIVEGVALVKKHQKAFGGSEGGIIEMATKIDASNIAIVDPKTKKASRIKYSIDTKGKKTRVATKSGEEIK
jgi:large subunit ribosomal protein L24